MELTGTIHYNSGGALNPRPPSEIDVAHIVRSAQIHEAAGYDRVLIANAAVLPDPHVIGTHVVANTKTLQLMMAHRPGVMMPTVAARVLATIDNLSNGRAGVHIIAGPNEKEIQADGEFIAKEDRYQRAREYVSLMRRMWSSPEPFDHEGPYYRFNRAFCEVKPVQRPGIPIFWGGASDTAVDVGGQVADIHALTGDSLKATREMLEKSRAAAARHGRVLRYINSFIVIVGDTEEAAWQKADQVLEEFAALQAKRAALASKAENHFTNIAKFARQAQAAEEGVRQDKCFWLGMIKATQGKSGNHSVLVCTPDQLADALMDYYDMGIGGFMLRGYRGADDAALFGKELFPRIRAAAAARDAKREQRRA